MASAQRVTYFKARIDDKPGALLGILKELKAKNLALAGLWAYAGEPGWTELFVIPRNADKLRSLWKGSPLMPEEGTAFFVKGSDRTGALLTTLEGIAKAGVNLVRTDAIAVAGKYGTFFLVAAADVEKMAKAVGAK